jgi:general secretion pathway protein I
MRRGERGLTLLEMIVATLIMGLAVVGLLSALSTSLRHASRLTDYDRVILMARGRMNELMLDRQLPRDAVVAGLFPPAVAGNLEAGWRARLSAFLMSPRPGAGQPAMDRLELEIWWTSGSVHRTFQLEGYRTRVLRPEDIPPMVEAP